MALYHLSGDEMGKTKKKKKSKEEKKKGKGEKKEKRKKKIAKVALASVRGAYLTVVSLNIAKTGKKMARVWNKPGGKESLIKKWQNMGGNADKLKKAIAKGSKETISGDDMGVATEVILANAAAAMIAFAPLIKQFKAEGDAKEAKEYDDAIETGKKELAENPDFEKSTADMPEDADVAKLKSRGGAKDGNEKDATPLSLGTNPVTISFLLPLMIAAMHLTNPVLLFIASIITSYCVVGMFLIPGYSFTGKNLYGTFSKKYFDVPVSCFNSVVIKISSILKSK